MCNDQSFTDFEVEYIRSAVCWKGAETIGPQSEAIYVFSQINWSVLFPLFIIKRSDCLRHLLPHQTKGTSSVCVCVCGFACFPRCVYFCSLSMECWLALLGLSTPPPPRPLVCVWTARYSSLRDPIHMAPRCGPKMCLPRKTFERMTRSLHLRPICLQAVALLEACNGGRRMYGVKLYPGNMLIPSAHKPALKPVLLYSCADRSEARENRLSLSVVHPCLEECKMVA